MNIEPSPAQVERLASSDDAGPVLMLNLLRFKDHADGIDAAGGISGAEAYARYGGAVAPFLERVGGRLEIHQHRAAALSDSRLIACKPPPA